MGDVAMRMGVPLQVLPTHLARDQLGAQIAAHLAAHAGASEGIFAATDTIAAACLAELRARGLVDLLLRRLAGEETESVVLPPQLKIRATA